jgi:hypothetical protein
MKNGDIIKSKYGTSTNQQFVVIITADNMNGIIIFDNLLNGIIGDTTIGYSLNDYVLSDYREFSEFIINNNISI